MLDKLKWCKADIGYRTLFCKNITHTVSVHNSIRAQLNYVSVCRSNKKDKRLDVLVHARGKSPRCSVLRCAGIHRCLAHWYMEVAERRAYRAALRQKRPHPHPMALNPPLQFSASEIDCFIERLSIAEGFYFCYFLFSFYLCTDVRFLQRVSIACYAERCISYDRFCPSVWPSDSLTVCLAVCHTLVSCQNDSSYDHAVFAGG